MASTSRGTALPSPPILTQPDGTQLQLGPRLGVGSTATVRPGIVNGRLTAFKTSVLSQKDRFTQENLCNLMEREAEVMAKIQRRQREIRRRGPFVDMDQFEYAGRIDGTPTASCRANPSAEPQPCVYVSMPPINNPLTDNTYVSVAGLIWPRRARWQEGLNLSSISAAHPESQPTLEKAKGINGKMLKVTELLYKLARAYEQAMLDFGLVYGDHCGNNTYVRDGDEDDPTTDSSPLVILIDHANGLDTRHRQGVPRPPAGFRPAAMVATHGEAFVREKQYPNYTGFQGAPEQLLHEARRKECANRLDTQLGSYRDRRLHGKTAKEMMRDLEDDMRRDRVMVGGSGQTERICLGSRTTVFQLGVLMHNILRGEKWENWLVVQQG